MSFELVLEGTGGALFHSIDNLLRHPAVGETVFLYDVEYKVEKVETYLEDVEEVNPHSGQVAVWSLTRQDYKVYLSEVL